MEVSILQNGLRLDWAEVQHKVARFQHKWVNSCAATDETDLDLTKATLIVFFLFSIFSCILITRVFFILQVAR